MRTVGEVLKEAREQKLLTLEDVEKHTKIRQELLKALEENAFDRLPPPTFVQGFIKNYAKYLNLEEHKMLALFRRDYESRRHPPDVMESLLKPVERRRPIRLTTSKILSAVIAIIILVFFVYLWFEYRQFTGNPELTIRSPQNEQTVDSTSVLIEGHTDPESKVTVNDGEIGVDENGNFKEEVKLSSSRNQVIITSTNKFGRKTTQQFTVFVKSSS